jgi:N-formylglutamate amidohydrolase
MSDPDVRRPIIVHVPHAGTLIPDDTRARFVASDEEIADDLASSTDHAVDELWRDAVDRGAIMFISHVSRLVCDLERYDRDALEPCAKFGRGVFYTRTCHGSPLRSDHDLSMEMAWLAREMMLAYYYVPWQDMIADTVDYLLGDFVFPAVTIIDAHSFPDEPLPFETDEGPRPDICLGWNDRHSPTRMRRPLVEFFRSHGLTVEENRPYAGSFVPRRHIGRELRLNSLMIEVNRRLYWNEEAGELDLPGLERMEEVLMEAFVLIDAMTCDVPALRSVRVVGEGGEA